MRGDLVTVAVQGDFGKPRPALVVQADFFGTHTSITVLLLSSALVEAPLLRIAVDPSATNGLRMRSQVMLDRAITVRRARLGPVFGRLDAGTMAEVDRGLAVFLGIAH